MSTIAGFFEIGIALAGVAPPVAAAVTVISLVLSAAEWVEEASQTFEQQDAFDSSLDPSRSFATEPSYVGLLVSLAFLGLSGLDVLDAGKSLHTLAPAVTTP